MSRFLWKKKIRQGYYEGSGKILRKKQFFQSSFMCYGMSTVPVHNSAPVATPTSFSPDVKSVNVEGITIKAMILVGCIRSRITNLISSIDTAVERSQLEFSPVITILRTCGSSPALSGRVVDSIFTIEHSSAGIVVVVVVGCIVVVVVGSAHTAAG